MIWQLLQAGMMNGRPLIFVGPIWRGLRSWIEQEIAGRGLASPEDLKLAVWVDTVGEALEVVARAMEDFLRRHKVILPPMLKEPSEAE